jgi:YjbE family integral membrane protein
MLQVQDMDMQTLAVALFNIIIIDLVLSGDNAIVIGMAVQALPPRQKRLAILIGGGAALVLRVVFTVIVTLVIQNQPPFLLAFGGLILVWITYRLLTPESEEAGSTEEAGRRGFIAAMSTIMIADVTMSLDNVLAVGVAAHGDPLLVLIGLILSMAILVAGGAFVATILNRMPWLNYVGGLILLVLVGEMIAGDPFVEGLLGGHQGWHQWAFTAFFALLLGVLLYMRRRRKMRTHTVEVVPASLIQPEPPPTIRVEVEGPPPGAAAVPVEHKAAAPVEWERTQ